ncbi:MAG: hypothetical protein JWQ73_2129 [Variovorax sp.]|nr:hypothetical protein [Variovorax sp.]
MTTSIQTTTALCGVLLAAALLGACGTTAVRVGGAPDKARTDCLTATARQYNLPRDSLTITNASSPRDGLYEIRIASADGRRQLVCNADDNGAVLGIVNAR